MQYAFAPVKKINKTIFVLDFVLADAEEWAGNYCIVDTIARRITAINGNPQFSEGDYLNALDICDDLAKGIT